jgi:Homeodomain-like domain
MEKFKVTLTTEERTALEHLVNVGKAAARKLAHARVLLQTDEGPGGPRYTDEEIMEVLHVSPSTISRVRERFETDSSPLERSMSFVHAARVAPKQ